MLYPQNLSESFKQNDYESINHPSNGGKIQVLMSRKKIQFTNSIERLEAQEKGSR